MTTDIASNALAGSGAGGMQAFTPCPSAAIDLMGIDEPNACGRAALEVNASGGGS